ncbi:MAG: APC family permease [Candidatus Comchoanobacterales bacterium]
MTKRLTTFSLMLMTVISVDSIRNMPIAASYGPMVVVYFILFAILFLLPAALASAELTSVFPDGGGIYTWVKEGLNKPLGLLAIWLQWAENIVYYPQQLMFVFVIIFFGINQMSGMNVDASMVDQNTYLSTLLLCGLVLFWVLSWINSRGLSMSVKLSDWMTYLGLIIPMVLLFIIFIYYITKGHSGDLAVLLEPNQWSTWLSQDSISSLQEKLDVVLLSYTGVEIATVHTRDVDNPKKSYPRALLLAAAIIMITQIIGCLAIYFSIPAGAATGGNGLKYIALTFYQYLTSIGLPWLTPVFCLLIACGLIGGLSNWILAPSRGLSIALKDQDLLPILTRNDEQTPNRILWLQTLVVSLLTVYLMSYASLEGAFGFLLNMMALVYLSMYLLMFLALPKVCQGRKNTIIPFGKFGVLLVACLGCVVSSIPIVLSILTITSWHEVLARLVFGLFMFVLPVLLSMSRKRP